MIRPDECLGLKTYRIPAYLADRLSNTTMVHVECYFDNQLKTAQTDGYGGLVVEVNTAALPCIPFALKYEEILDVLQAIYGDVFDIYCRESPTPYGTSHQFIFLPKPGTT